MLIFLRLLVFFINTQQQFDIVTSDDAIFISTRKFISRDLKSSLEIKTWANWYESNNKHIIPTTSLQSGLLAAVAYYNYISLSVPRF